jgi:hypothetical protein
MYLKHSNTEERNVLKQRPRNNSILVLQQPTMILIDIQNTDRYPGEKKNTDSM